MTYHGNEASVVKRLEQRVQELQNEQRTDGILIAGMADRIAELSDQLKAAGAFCLNSVDQATYYLARERDEARAVARELINRSIVRRRTGTQMFQWECLYCHARNFMAGDVKHAPDCPVTKVRAWGDDKEER